MPGNPVKLSGVPDPPTRAPAPDLDADRRRILEELEGEAEAMLRGTGVPEADRAIERAADCRYTKQAYELTVPLAGGTVTRETLAALAREFHGQHLRTYGHENPSEPVQLVNVRVTATGRMSRVEFHADAAGAAAGAAGAETAPATRARAGPRSSPTTTSSKRR